MVEHLGSTRELWSWDHAGSKLSYQGVLQLCLADESIRRHFGHRGITEDSLTREALSEEFVRDTLSRIRSEYVAYRQSESEAENAQYALITAQAARVIDGPMKLCIVLLACAPLWLLINFMFTGGDLSNLPALLTPAVAFGVLVWAVSKRPQSQQAVESVLAWYSAWSTARLRQRSHATRSQIWRRSLRAALVPKLQILVDQMLGPDQESLLRVEDHGGLRDVHAPEYVVPSNAEALLRQKMEQLDGGTIAVCGPRGAGKSTLLRACSTRPNHGFDLTVFVQAPADYTPQDFLLTLFGEVCERYLEFYGAPVGTGLFTTRRRRQELQRRAWRALKWLVCFLLAVAALTGAFSRGLQWSYYHFLKPQVIDHVGHWWSLSRDWVMAFWTDYPWWSSAILFVAGMRLMPTIRFRKRTPQMLLTVQRCQHYLYRLRTVQSSSSTVNIGAPGPQEIAFGHSKTTSMSSVPLTFPELVADFRELLTEIAVWHPLYFRGARVVIAIDELDRVGNTAQARKFLGEIKAIFGIENVYFLLSVAEDLGAAFVRRGLPHRDVTDSSLDDLLYVPPRTLSESQDMLARRASSITPPFVQLLHALSGGVPRDLIRYARRLVEVHRWTTRSERKDLAPAVICEELGDTLEGFRTLMAAHQWSPDTGRLLTSLQTLVQLLRSPVERDTAESRDRIRDLAANPLASPASSLTTGARSPRLPDEALMLWQEASACAYFSLTLLEIFGTPNFELLRSRAADGGRDGKPQRLAEARQELAVSPHSARIMLDDIREAWGLAVYRD
ncbi:AAA family ATPase [Kitasatospora purpeofusca]|uniref:AAA family ATPase n=1 Tax=Kitasatospora purpeofusca TaxID=67352 RepID=UPI0036A8EAB4